MDGIYCKEHCLPQPPGDSDAQLGAVAFVALECPAQYCVQGSHRLARVRHNSHCGVSVGQPKYGTALGADRASSGQVKGFANGSKAPLCLVPKFPSSPVNKVE